MFPSEWCFQVMFPSLLLPLGNVCPWNPSCSASFVWTRRWPVSFDFVKNPIPQISQTNDRLFVQEFIWAEIEDKNKFRSNFEDEYLSLNCHFCSKITKMITIRQFPDFDGFTLNMNFAYFQQMAIMMGICLKIFKNYI